MSPYPHLLAPLDTPAGPLRNRIVMGAMHTRLETLDRPNERLAAFYGRRARGEAALLLTGGYAPNHAGIFEPGAPRFSEAAQSEEHRAIVDAVHAEGGRIALQIVHAGRYAKHALCVGPSAARSRINPIAPRVLSTDEVWDVIGDFAHTAKLAAEVGYDGVEIMGSEGYLINQFTAPVTNDRTDAFGGDLDARIKLPLEIVRAVRAATSSRFLIVYRISAIDLVDGGMPGEEVAELARRVEEAGANIINTGIGWHESVVPTIAASVPRSAWSFAVANVKRATGLPVIASNRINTPETAEALLADGVADLVSMARPLLADPDFPKKARLGRAAEINTCIACNQACLDRIFTDRTATCLVNPRAGREIEFPDGPAPEQKAVAVIGGGPAGMAFAINAAERGHSVTLFEREATLGGQLNMARVVPGKAEFNEMLRYFRTRLADLGVDVRLGRDVSAPDLEGGNYHDIIVATGVTPRLPPIPGLDHPCVLTYADVLLRGAAVGERVAIIGAGGIGFDMAEYLVGDEAESLSPDVFLKHWGVDATLTEPGGLAAGASGSKPRRQVTILQRKSEALGKRLGKSTGWILKSRLRRLNVSMIGGVTYERIDDAGLHYGVDGESRTLAVDTIVLCAGQESERGPFEALRDRGASASIIGGADVAAELDALRAIDQATRLAVAI